MLNVSILDASILASSIGVQLSTALVVHPSPVFTCVDASHASLELRSRGGVDEVSALVVDCGSQWTKVGYAGEDTPRSLLPSDMGVLEDAAASAGAGDERAMDVDGAGSAAAAAPQTAIGLAKKTSRKTYIGSAALSVRRDGEEVVNPIKNGLSKQTALDSAHARSSVGC